MKTSILFLLLCLCALPLAAQDDAPTVQPIGIGMTVEETISAAAPFDWWRIEARAGDVISIELEAYEGLAPLIGVLSADGTLISRSADGAPNTAIRLRFTFPQDGAYTIVAARAGLDVGTTTGRYTLHVARVGAPAAVDPLLQEVVFACRDQEAVTLATIGFEADGASDMSSYRITVLGEPGIAPVIRFKSSEQGTDECILPDSRDRIRATFTLPDGTTGASNGGSANQLVVNPAGLDLGEITVILGALDGGSGRYIALIEGFGIQPVTDTDTFSVRLGALPGESTPLRVYMVQTTGRLDPLLMLDEAVCDDAGRRGCEQVAFAAGTGVAFELYGTVAPDRFDAGALIEDTLPHTLTLSSFANRTTGNYALMLVGEQPPRDFND